MKRRPWNAPLAPDQSALVAEHHGYALEVAEHAIRSRSIRIDERAEAYRDLAVDTLIAAARSHKPGKNSFKTFFRFAFARRLDGRLELRFRRTLFADHLATEPAGNDGSLDSELAYELAIKAALVGLDPRCRDVVPLVAFEGLEQAQVADRMGRSQPWASYVMRMAEREIAAA